MESLYFLWRTTGEHRWREYAWGIFESIEKYTKTESGYASVDIGGNGEVSKKNEMPRCVNLRLVRLDELFANPSPCSALIASSSRKRMSTTPLL